MKLLNWLMQLWRDAFPKIQILVDPQFGKRQLALIDRHINRKKYQVGDSIESVAYRQGQIDLRNFIEIKLVGGKIQ